jgi:menaquinone-specific isochorismate synthase
MTRMTALLPHPDLSAPESATAVVRTVRIEEQVDLLGHVPEGVSGAWLRHGQGMVALGRAWPSAPSPPAPGSTTRCGCAPAA